MGILFIVLAHLIVNQYFKRFAFSFHVPLFFLVAGYLSKEQYAPSDWVPLIKKSAKRLLLPYFITMICICLWTWRFEILKMRFHLSLQPVLNILWGSGDSFTSSWGTLYVGPLWFLIALFYVRILFVGLNIIVSKCTTHYQQLWLIIIAGCMSLLAILLYPIFPPLPWNPLPGIAALLFVVIGWYYHHYPMPKWVNVIAVVLWISSLCFCDIDARLCLFSPYIIVPYIGAVGGALLVCIIAKVINKYFACLGSFVQKIGRYSLLILCVHSFDLLSGFGDYWLNLCHAANITFIYVLWHVMIPVFVVFIICFIRRNNKRFLS